MKLARMCRTMMTAVMLPAVLGAAMMAARADVTLVQDGAMKSAIYATAEVMAPDKSVPANTPESTQEWARPSLLRNHLTHMRNHIGSLTEGYARQSPLRRIAGHPFPALHFTSTGSLPMLCFQT